MGLKGFNSHRVPPPPLAVRPTKALPFRHAPQGGTCKVRCVPRLEEARPEERGNRLVGQIANEICLKCRPFAKNNVLRTPVFSTHTAQRQ